MTATLALKQDVTPYCSTAQADNAYNAYQALQWVLGVAHGAAHPQSRPQRIEPATWRNLPASELRQVFDVVLMSRHTPAALQALYDIGVLDVWLPEVASLVGFGGRDWRHKDVWRHTKQVVWQSVPRLTVRWGALLHDIGKVKTRRLEADGKVTFHGHAEVGAAMFRKRIAKRLPFESSLYQRTNYLIYHHLRGSQYDGTWTDGAVRRFYREMGDGLDDLLLLSRADITTKYREKRRRALTQISELARRIRVLKEEDAKPPALPKGLGTLLMQRFDIPPSKELGNWMRRLMNAVESGELERQQPMAYYADWVATQRLHP